MKVGKEELIGLLTALKCFVEEDHDALVKEWRERSHRIADALDPIEGVTTSVSFADKVSVAPEVVVMVDPTEAQTDATSVVGRLRRENPRVFVGADSLPESFTINPMCLDEEQTSYVVDRLHERLTATEQ